MSTLLNGYDLVLAISQNTLNNQFFLLLAEGTIDSRIDIAYAPALPDLALHAQINAPTVQLVMQPASPLQAVFNINLKSGTFTYMDYALTPPLQTADVSGWVFSMVVDLTQMSINSTQPEGLVVSADAQNQLGKYVGDAAFSLRALFLDFDNVNLSTVSVTAGDVKMQPSDARYPWVLTAIQQLIANIKSSGNPYILGYHAASNDPTQTTPQVPLLASTSMQFVSDQYNYPAGSTDHSQDGLSALCYVTMTANKAVPYPDNKVPSFSWNPIPAAAVQGCMFIDNATFNRGYVMGAVLPVLSAALQSGVAWTQTGNSWTLTDNRNDGSQNDGHGPVVGSDSGILDIYGLHTDNRTCTLTLNTKTSVDNQLVYDGTGSFYRRLDLYEKPLGIWAHDAWTSSTLPFTFTLTLTAGADGSITAKLVPKQGSSSQDNWANFVVKATDVIGQLFNASLEDQLQKIDDSYTAFEQGQFSQFSSGTAQAFQALSEQLILPAPKQFYYSNIALNSENDVVLEIGYKS
jgi:hypothetical protein